MWRSTAAKSVMWAPGAFVRLLQFHYVGLGDASVRCRDMVTTPVLDASPRHP
jgi:hypothetical protein